MKRKLLFAALCVVSVLGQLRAQTDVTSTYIANPSFELTAKGVTRTAIWQQAGTVPSGTIFGWALTQSNPDNSYENVNITDNTTSNAGFGTAVTPADGTYYFFNRRGWAQVSNTLTATSLSNLSVGTYFLSVKYKAAYSDNNGESAGPSVTIKAKQGESELASQTSINGPKSPGNTYFNTSGWQSVGVKFIVSEAGSVDFIISYSLDGRHGRGDVLLDDVRLYNLTAASSSDPADLTGMISNASFENRTWTGTQADGSSTGDSGGTLNKPTGYTCYFNVSGWKDCSENTTNPADGSYCINSWFGVITEQKFYQTINNLPEGVYEISAQVRTDQTSTDGIYTYGIAGGDTFKSASWDASKMAGTWNSMENWQTLTARASIIGSGSLQLGLRSDKFVQFDDFHLTYLGSDLLLAELKSSFSAKQTTANGLLGNSDYDNVVGTERTTLTTKKGVTPEETVAGWTTAVNELQDAIDAFTAAKANYDALAAEITKATALGFDASEYAATSSTTSAAALTNTQSLKVNEYAYVTTTYEESATLGSWTENFAEDLNGEGYVADGERYWNEWGSATRTGKQTVTLPAGDYAVYCIARGAVGTSGYLYYKIGSSDAVTTSFNMKGNRGKGVDTSGAANFGSGTYTCDNNGFGWEYNFLTFTLAAESDVEIGVSTTFASNWVSVYKPQLLTTEATVKALRLTEIATALASVPSGKMNADVQSTLDDKADAAGDASGSNTKDELTTILDDLNDAIDAANASIAAYASVKAAIDYAKGVSLTGSSLDISTYEDAYNDASMLDSDAAATVTAIKEALTTALISQTLVADVTALLTNPSFENGTTGWSAQYSSTAGNSWGTEENVEATDGSKVLTMHTDNGWFTGYAIDQAVTLPVGYYRLTADVKSTNVDVNTYIFASTNTTWSGKDMTTLGTAKVENTDTWESLEATFYVDAKKTVYLGVTTEGPNWNGGTYANYKADNFQLYYLGDASANMTIAAGKYGTFVAPFAVTIPDGVTVKKVTGVSGTSLTYAAVETTIPQNTPVLVTSTSAVDQNFYGKDNSSGAATVKPDGQLLTGVYKDATVPANSYILQTHEDVQAFYKLESSATMKVYNRAYLTVPAAEAKAFYFDEADGINTVQDAEFTVNGSEIYNLAGQRMSKPMKGVNIVNGKKVLVK